MTGIASDRKKQKNLPVIKMQYTFSYLKCETVSVVNWIGILGMFEYLFSDLTSLQWFLFKNGARLSEIMGEEYLQTTRGAGRICRNCGKNHCMHIKI